MYRFALDSPSKLKAAWWSVELITHRPAAPSSASSLIFISSGHAACRLIHALHTSILRSSLKKEYTLALSTATCADDKP